MSVVRIVRGDPAIIDLPKATSDAFEAGDICWWDSAAGVVRRASQAPGADHDARSQVVGTNFVGVCMARREAGDTGRVPIATRGDFQFRVGGAGAITVNDMVRVTDNSGTPSNDQVQAHATATRCIGRAVSVAANNTVTVRIVGRVNLL
jgi:hypothetical protein